MLAPWITALLGCSTEAVPDSNPNPGLEIGPPSAGAAVGEAEAGASAIEADDAPTSETPLDVERPTTGPQIMGPTMTFIDPETRSDGLLWLRADRGVLSRGVARWDGVQNTGLTVQSPAFETGDVDFGFACRVRVDQLPTVNDLGGATQIAGKWESGGGNAEWLLALEGPTAADQFHFRIRDADGRVVPGPRTALPGGVQVGRWYFVFAWHDAANDTLNLSVDGVEAPLVAHSSGVSTGNSKFHLGAGDSGTPAISLARAAFFKDSSGNLGRNAAEIVATLSGGAAGGDESDLSADQPFTWGLQALWPLDESGGSRVPSFGKASLSLADPSKVGNDLGPFARSADHGSRMADWVDQIGHRTYSAPSPSSRPSWFGDSTRLLTSGDTERLDHGAIVLGGRSSWTLSVSMEVGRQSVAWGLWSEQGGLDDSLDVRIGADGVPELAIAAPGIANEVVARASESLLDARSVSSATASALNPSKEGVPQSRCVLEVGPGHRHATADRVVVAGVGAPFDGTHTVTNATTTEIVYVVDAPDPAESSLGPGGQVAETGAYTVSPVFKTEAGAALEYHRRVLSVVRDGSTVRFYRDGVPIGSATIPDDRLGPTSGTSRVLAAPGRSVSPLGTIDNVFAADTAFSDDEVAGLAARFSVKANRTNGVGPLSVHFDATDFAGIDRMTTQDHEFLWSFVRRDDRRLHDDSKAPWGGQSYARATGFYVSQVFDAEGEYDAYLAVVAPPYDRTGAPQPRVVIAAGKVAAITVDSWPSRTVTHYVSTSDPGRAPGLGRSADSPMDSGSDALRLIRRPYTRILFRSGDRIALEKVTSLSDLKGPILIGSYDDPSRGRPTLVSVPRSVVSSTSAYGIGNVHDVRVVGIDLEDTGVADNKQPDYVKIVFYSQGNCRLLLLSNLASKGTNRLLYGTPSDRFTTIDRLVDTGVGDYVVFHDGARDFSVTRSILDSEPTAHFIRCNEYCRVYIAGLSRTLPWNQAKFPTWVTLRHEGRYAVINDNDCPDSLDIPSDPGKDYYVANQTMLVERNRTFFLAGTGDRLTTRGNLLRGVNKWLDDDTRNRIGLSEEIRAYGNQVVSSGRLWNWGSKPFVVMAENQYGTSGPDGEETGKPIEVPSIAMGSPGLGYAVLSASGYGKGGRFPLQFQWMRRPAGSDSAFERLEGQTAASIIDVPDAPGDYEYRLDLADAADARAEGAETLILTIDGPSQGGDDQGGVEVSPDPESIALTIEVPDVAYGRADRRSGTFTVTLVAATTNGPVVVRPSSDLPGTFSPSTITLTPESRSATFTFLPEAFGTHRISIGNDTGLASPKPVSYTATTPILPPVSPEPIGDRPPSDAVEVVGQLEPRRELAAPPRKTDHPVAALTGRRVAKR